MTMRNLDNSLISRLRIRAATHGRLREEEAHDILRSTLNQSTDLSCGNLAAAIRARFAPLGGAELPIPAREPMRDPPDFEA